MRDQPSFLPMIVGICVYTVIMLGLGFLLGVVLCTYVRPA